MRGNPEAHELIAPGSLDAVLHLLAAEPGVWTPIAGGTELMVAHAAGRLNARKLVSLWGIPDLRFIRVEENSIILGAGATFIDLRKSAAIARNLPLLAKASAWIGSIANQSRATLGGNLVNGSPAADSSPALLACDAEIEIVSVRGRRSIPYSEFHTGYKRNVLAPDELIFAVHLPRRFAHHRQYLRKVGTRRAMAISKVALAATALVETESGSKIIREIRLGAASLAAFPVRLFKTEAAILDRPVNKETIRAARSAVLAEALPIDDIRSTAEYRRRVAANLVEEFLRELMRPAASLDAAPINSTLAAWNAASESAAFDAMIACCGARRWAQAVVAQRPFSSTEELFAAADRVWSTMEEPDWMEAFACHPRIGGGIGERKAHAMPKSVAWSAQEQSGAAQAAERVLAALAAGNAQYEERFGFTYIVCATGKSAEQMLAILNRRLASSRADELREAAEQQRQITQIRLRKWMQENG
jgi:OHCU decarboxylase